MIIINKLIIVIMIIIIIIIIIKSLIQTVRIVIIIINIIMAEPIGPKFVVTWHEKIYGKIKNLKLRKLKQKTKPNTIYKEKWQLEEQQLIYCSKDNGCEAL